MAACAFQLSAIILCFHIIKEPYSIFWILQLYSICFTVYGGVLFLLDKNSQHNKIKKFKMNTRICTNLECNPKGYANCLEFDSCKKCTT